ncbi:hypothetical protein [Streptosporangium sp. KLBMP 9127]|nr:hypothetical protein [Streptosporangium sp. KLBMP 9127]
MRLRTIATALGAAAALVLSLPGTAGAADGTFYYTYYDEYGQPLDGTLVHPVSGECFDIPEAVVESASAPRNWTRSTAVVFTEFGCAGNHYSLRPLGGAASDRLKLRSVVFS